jgi:hypothetical protein
MQSARRRRLLAEDLGRSPRLDGRRFAVRCGESYNLGQVLEQLKQGPHASD